MQNDQIYENKKIPPKSELSLIFAFDKLYELTLNKSKFDYLRMGM